MNAYVRTTTKILASITLPIAGLTASLLITPAHAETPPLPTVEEVLAGYAQARGGADRWEKAQAITLEGIYATFSEKHPFTLLRARPHHYRFDFTMLGNSATHARDAHGTWWTYPLLGVAEATRLSEGPYRAQIERASWFAPPLIGAPENGVTVTVRGHADVDGMPALDVGVTLPDGTEETWFLDPTTYLEIAIDRSVHDHSQGPNPMPLRAFFADFRAVAGLVLPHRVDLEFGARLEVMEVQSATVPTAIETARFAGPTPE